MRDRKVKGRDGEEDKAERLPRDEGRVETRRVKLTGIPHL